MSLWEQLTMAPRVLVSSSSIPQAILLPRIKSNSSRCIHILGMTMLASSICTADTHICAAGMSTTPPNSSRPSRNASRKHARNSSPKATNFPRSKLLASQINGKRPAFGTPRQVNHCTTPSYGPTLAQQALCANLSRGKARTS